MHKAISDEKPLAEYDNNAFYARLCETLHVTQEFATDKDKREVLRQFVDDLPENLNAFMEIQARDERLFNGKFEFASPEAKEAYWEKMLTGHVFEMVVETEHFVKNPNQIKPDAEGIQPEAARISHILIEVAKHPSDYGLMLPDGRNIPDNVYNTFDKKSEDVLITGLGEAKSGAQLDSRAAKQLQPEGSRQTVRMLVDAINEAMEKGFKGPQFKLGELAHILKGRKLRVVDDLSLEVIMTSDINVPDKEQLQSEVASGIDLGMAPEHHKFQKLFRRSSLDKDDSVYTEHIATALTEVESGKIAFRNSSFSKKDITSIVRAVMNNAELQLDYPGEVVKKSQNRDGLGISHSQEKNEAESPAEVSIAEIVAGVTTENLPAYTKWLITHLMEGSNVDVGKDQHKKLLEVEFERVGNAMIARDPVSGIATEPVLVDSDEPEQFSKAKKTAKSQLKPQLDAHLHDWREALESSGVLPGLLNKNQDGGDSPVGVAKDEREERAKRISDFIGTLRE